MTHAPSVLQVHGLTVVAGDRKARRTVVDSVSFDVRRGETLGIVGESGSGKTLAALGSLALVPDGVRVVAGSAHLLDDDLLSCSKARLRSVRGRVVGVVFQDPLTSLHPSIRVGDQLVEALRVHDRSMDRVRARRRAAELLERVGVPRARDRMDDHPHQWSGGMRQRAMIAMAMAHDPVLIVADEPTTALDVTMQAQILRVLAVARAETGAAVLLISHDLGVIAEAADRVLVMYDGRVVEEASVEALFAAPQHPYTAALLASVPTLSDTPGSLSAIAGQPPTATGDRHGCAFEPRCPIGHGNPLCADVRPALVGPAERRVACHFPGEAASEP